MTDDPNPYEVWQAWRPHEVAQLFSSLTIPWWIAGGWALDLFLGVQTREHHDIDVQILRRDQQAVRALLQQWDIDFFRSLPCGFVEQDEGSDLLVQLLLRPQRPLLYRDDSRILL